jgi:cation diffusion facilitator family transporter
LIGIAASSIVFTAFGRLLDPQPLEQIGIGLFINSLATAVNLFVARILLKAGKENHSIVLEADGHHLMTDVWTSAGVVAGIGLVTLTGWWRLDPIIAMLVAVNILWSGWNLIKRSVHGLMDGAITEDEQNRIIEILDGFKREKSIEYLKLQTRQSGNQKFIKFNLLIPPDWNIQNAHDLTDRVENSISEKVINAKVFIHLEPL